MRIQQIHIQNVLGISRVDLALTAPVTLIAGGNGQGKSSLCESIRMALGESPARVALKKEFGMLVKEGAKRGLVQVAADGAEFSISLPDGKRVGPDMSDVPALPFVLDPARFSALPDADRRTFLFSLTGCSTSGKAVAAELAKRGCNADKIAEVLPLIRSGFPAACDYAKERAKEAKADWKAITGETYGEKKAETWEADTPEPGGNDEYHALTEKIAALDADIRQRHEAIGSLKQRASAYTVWTEQQAKRETLIAKLPDLRIKLERHETDIKTWTEKVESLKVAAGTGPRVGLVHDLAFALDALVNEAQPSGIERPAYQNALTALGAYEGQYGPLDAQSGPEAASKLREATQALELCTSAAANTRRDIAAAEAAQQAAVDGAPEPISVEQISQAQADIDDLMRQRKAADESRQMLAKRMEAAQLAKTKTAKAAEHHRSVTDWLQIADALAPDGIPGELLAHALQPINDRLRQSAIDTGWPQASIAADMTIAADGRPYRLLSESEKWRVDAMIGEAIAHLSGLRLLMLDRMDVLEISARGDLLGWLDGLAYANQIDTALVFATLKSVPSGLPDTIQGLWLQGGAIAETAETVAA